MSNARDELADELWKHHYEEYTMNPDGTERSYCQCGAPVYPMKSLVQHQAESALKAGYSKPRTVSTVAELDALPVGSVIRLLDRGYVYERTGDESTFPEDDWASPLHYVMDEDWLPATVLYTPDAPTETGTQA